jgi:lipoprotein-anchoring transpeptidase ErfK/SrfK
MYARKSPPLSTLAPMRERTIRTLLVCAMLATLVSCGHSDKSTLLLPAPTAPTSTVTQPATTGTTAPTTTTTAPALQGTYVATATGTSVAVYPSPTGATPAQVLPNPWVVDPTRPAANAPQVFLVARDQPIAGRVEVQLPVRPNGSTGWVRMSDVSLARVSYHVLVELGRRRITVSNGALTVYQGAVAVGATATPTPTGHYYVRVLIRAPDPHTVYGPFAYGLSSHSDKLSTFNGGDGEIGIHGNDDASVLGRNVTHGCIRMDNAQITRLAQLLPLGTPVDVEQ